jgi:hypothetical protein
MEAALFMEALEINVGYLILQVICFIIVPILIVGGFVIYLIRKNQSKGGS